MPLIGLFAAALVSPEFESKIYDQEKLTCDPIYVLLKEAGLKNEEIDKFLITYKVPTNIEEIFDENDKSTQYQCTPTEYKNLHDFLFEHIVWNEKEKREKKSGLYIKTLELGGPQKIIFKLVKNFTILKFLNKFIKISKKVAKKNAEIYASSSAIVAISVNEDKNKDYVNTGRMMQRLWLTATHLGLSAHPSTGVILLAQRIHAGDAFKLSNNHVSIIEKAYAEIKNIFGIENDTIKMILRIGDGGKPSAYSSRLEPEIIFE